MGIAVLVLILACVLGLVYFFYQGPIFVPTLRLTVDQMALAADIKPGMKTADLGSGDGRIIVAFAQKGACATGFEINPLLVWYSRMKIKRLGLSDRAVVSAKSFWGGDLSEFDVVTVFGIGHMMARLEQKVLREMKPGSLVISNAFKFPNLKLVRAVGSLLVYQL